MPAKGQYKTQSHDSLAVEGNKGGSFINITHVNPEQSGNDIVHVEVGHDCVIRINEDIPVVILAAILSRSKDIGFQKLLAEEYEHGSEGIPQWVQQKWTEKSGKRFSDF